MAQEERCWAKDGVILGGLLGPLLPGMTPMCYNAPNHKILKQDGYNVEVYLALTDKEVVKRIGNRFASKSFKYEGREVIKDSIIIDHYTSNTYKIELWLEPTRSGSMLVTFVSKQAK